MELTDTIDVAKQRRQFKTACLVWLAVWTFALCVALSRNLFTEWRLNNHYIQTDAVILDKQLEPGEDGEYEAKFLVRYRVQGAGEPYQSWAYYQAYPQPRDRATAKGLFD